MIRNLMLLITFLVLTGCQSKDFRVSCEVEYKEKPVPAPIIVRACQKEEE